MRPRDPEMLDVYPEQVARTGIQDVWKHRPVSLETCDTPAGWERDGFDVTYILNQALRWHVTSVNVKSSPIPPHGMPSLMTSKTDGISLCSSPLPDSAKRSCVSSGCGNGQ
jgi:hypothetical protein